MLKNKPGRQRKLENATPFIRQQVVALKKWHNGDADGVASQISHIYDSQVMKRLMFFYFRSQRLSGVLCSHDT